VSLANGTAPIAGCGGWRPGAELAWLPGHWTTLDNTAQNGTTLHTLSSPASGVSADACAPHCQRRAGPDPLGPGARPVAAAVSGCLSRRLGRSGAVLVLYLVQYRACKSRAVTCAPRPGSSPLQSYPPHTHALLPSFETLPGRRRDDVARCRASMPPTKTRSGRDKPRVLPPLAMWGSNLHWDARTAAAAAAAPPNITH